MHQTTLFPESKSLSIGDIVISKITGNKIRIEKLKEDFIVGRLVDFIQFPINHTLRKCYAGEVIVRKSNII